MFQKTLTLILALASLFFIGYGVTGFATISENALCQDDLDCQYSVCCPIHESEYGVCAQQADCSRLYFDYKESGLQAAPDVSDTAERSYIAVVLGVVILMILAIVGYFEWKHEKALKKSKKK